MQSLTYFKRYLSFFITTQVKHVLSNERCHTHNRYTCTSFFSQTDFIGRYYIQECGSYILVCMLRQHTVWESKQEGLHQNLLSLQLCKLTVGSSQSPTIFIVNGKAAAHSGTPIVHVQTINGHSICPTQTDFLSLNFPAILCINIRLYCLYTVYQCQGRIPSKGPHMFVSLCFFIVLFFI